MTLAPDHAEFRVTSKSILSYFKAKVRELGVK